MAGYLVLLPSLLKRKSSYIILSIHKDFLLYETYWIVAFYQWASSGVYYLLGLWSRLVTSVPYLKGNSPNLLNEFVPKIIEHFISSKFDSIQVRNTMLFYLLLGWDIDNSICYSLFIIDIVAGWFVGWSLRGSTWQCWTPSGSAWMHSLPLQISG